MRPEPIPLALAFLLCLSVPLAPLGATPAQRSQLSPPPGTVLIPGGRTKLGSEVRAIERLLERNEGLRQNAVPFATETPQFTETVDPFFLMVNPVTNEQFKAFVQATGARPPQLWGAEAIDAGRVAFLEEQEQARREAQRAGQTPGRRQPFDPGAWWRANWKGAKWEMPPSRALEPVVYVDHNDATEYARWAGMRLPTEFEFQRAVRGTSDRSFPWGDDWEPGRAATNELQGTSNVLLDVFPIASFPQSATAEGVHDLVGNVWEWTSSPYVAYPGHKDFELRFGRGRGDRMRVSAQSRFDANQRVAVGGSVHNNPFVARCTTRRGTERRQSTSNLGFRCAASVEVGRDMADIVLLEHISPSIRPIDVNGNPVDYVPNATVAMDRWSYRNGSNHAKSMALPEGLAKETSTAAGALPPQYAVITGYDYVVFVPVDEVYAAGVNDLRETSLTKSGPVHIGILALSIPTVEPELEAGTYLVAIRGAGEPRKQRPGRGEAAGEEGEEQEPEVEIAPIQEHLPEINIQVDNFIFYDMTGTPVRSMRMEAFDWGNTTASITAITQRKRIEMHGEEEVEVTHSWYEQRLFVPGRGRLRGARLTLPLRFEDGVLEGEWRRK